MTWRWRRRRRIGKETEEEEEEEGEEGLIHKRKTRCPINSLGSCTCLLCMFSSCCFRPGTQRAGFGGAPVQSPRFRALQATSQPTSECKYWILRLVER